MPSFIARVRTFLKAKRGLTGWDSDERGATFLILAYSLQVMGEQSGKNEHLKEALTIYQEALQEYHRERVPLKWAETKDYMGLALSSLGERECGIKRLQEAVVSHREALMERTRERVLLDWAVTQNNLGLALTRLGERECGNKQLT